MKKLVIFMLFIALAGCDDSGVSRSKKLTLKCGSYDVAIEVLDSDTLQTAVNGEKITMNRANSASNVRRYEGKGAVVSVSLRLKGSNIWSLNIDNSGQISCVAAVKK